jgi:hypothetical protein
MPSRSRLSQWQVSMVGVAVTVAAGVAAVAETPDAAQVARLVHQLGSPRFIERQIATESLSSLGLSVEGPVKQAESHRDPEVRMRARQILRFIRHADRQRLINAFVAGADVPDDADLPGWSSFQQIAGRDDHARQLYVQMLEDEWEFLDAVYQSEPPVASSLVAGRIMSLDVASRRKESVTVGNIASLLLVASREEIELINQASLISLCYRSSDFDAAIRSGTSRESLRALLGRVIAGGAGNPSDPYLTQRFHFSLYYDLKEGLEPARQVLREELGIPHVRQYALLVLGKLGDPQDEALIETLLDDPSPITSQNRANRPRLTTQVRDVALAVLIHRHGGRFQDYGMSDVRPHMTTLLQLTTVGFATEKEREQAIATWNQQHDGTPDATKRTDTPTADQAPEDAQGEAESDRRFDVDPVDLLPSVPVGPHDE